MRKLSWLFSLIGVVIVFGIVVIANYLSGLTGSKLDLTEYKIYTLSDGTKNILGQLENTVEVRLYATKDKRLMPAWALRHADRVEELLREYVKAAPDDKLRLKVFNPEPDTEDEDKANLDGLRGEQLQSGDNVYLSLVIEQFDRVERIPFLDPNRDNLLEYDISSAIDSVSREREIVIGLMTDLPMAGMMPQMNPMNPMARSPQSPPWFIYQQLAQRFQIEEFDPASTEKIEYFDPERNSTQRPDVLLIVHPNSITPEVEFAVDQYILQGGKVIAFLDSYSALSAQSNSGEGSNLPRLLDAWGTSFPLGEAVADETLMTGIDRTLAPNLGVLSVTKEYMAENQPATAQIGNLLLGFSGYFSKPKVTGLDHVILAKSSGRSALVDPASLLEGDTKKIDPSNESHIFALQLSGKFKTAFPNGRPKVDSGESASDDSSEDEKASEQTFLKVAENETSVVLVADSDMLFDVFLANFMQLGNQRFPTNLISGNLAFVLNTIDLLSGNNDLVKLRSRGSNQRPFTKFNEMRAEAEEKRKKELDEVNKKIAEANEKLAELQRKNPSSDTILIDQSTANQIEAVNKQVAIAKEQRRTIDKELKRDLERLESQIQGLNLFSVPALMLVLALGHFFFRRVSISAQ